MKPLFLLLPIILLAGCATQKPAAIPIASTAKVEQNLAVLKQQLNDGVQMSSAVGTQFKKIQDASDVIGAYLAAQDNKDVRTPLK